MMRRFFSIKPAVFCRFANCLVAIERLKPCPSQRCRFLSDLANNRVDVASPVPSAENRQPVNFEEFWPNRLESLAGLYPSQAFLSRLTANGRERAKKLIKELELYSYLSDKYPPSMNDAEWDRLIRLVDVRERVCYIEFLAVRNRRAQQDQQVKEKRRAAYGERKREREELDTRLLAGEMTYASGLHQLVHNPLRNEKRLGHLRSCRAWSAIRESIFPEFLIDMQCMKDASETERSMIGFHIQMAYHDFFDDPIPASFKLVNFNERLLADMRKRYIGAESIYEDQRLAPDVTSKSVKDLFPNRNDVICIDPHAVHCLRGPLIAKAYVILASRNANQECKFTFAKDHLITRRLPIRELLNWNLGTQNLPVNKTIRILKAVTLNGGDWQTALETNIARRHTVPESERTPGSLITGYRRREHYKERNAIIGQLYNAVWGQEMAER